MSSSVRMIMWILAGAAAFVAAAGEARAVAVGDVAVISYASLDPDSMTFVVLREIPAGTAIRFTDSGWRAAGGFRPNEGGIQFTAAATLTPGTVVSKVTPFTSGGWAVNNEGVGNSGFALALAGDQILTFVGASGSPQFLHAIHFHSTGYGDSTSSNTTGLPPGLTVGTSAVALPDFDNGYYNGPTTGTPEAILAAIASPGNWVTSNSAQTLPNWVFTITGGQPIVTGINVAGQPFDVNDSAQITVTLNVAPAAGQPVNVQLTSGAFAAPAALVISNPNSSGVANVALPHEGIWTATATATSGGSGSATSSNFTVGNPLIAPTAYAGSDRNVELRTSVVVINFSGATGDDANGLDGLTYTWTPVTTTGLVSWQNRTGIVDDPAAPGAASATLNALGVYTFTLTVTDSGNLTATDSLTVFVNAPTTDDEYGPPSGYYTGATAQGATLKTQLSQIITAGHNQQNYGAIKTSSARYDADPAVPGNILLVYNRASVSAAWDAGATWNREHLWPQSLQPGDASDSTTGNLGDPYCLKPCDPGINSSRGNKPFGNFATTGGYGSQGTFYFPGDADKGDVARALFYSATRYMSTLSLVNGAPSGNTMGDLASLVRWNYTDTPDSFERRRGHLIFQDQGNRNPYIDRPEFVWSVFGDGANDSTLYVSASQPADGTSTVSIDYPAIIVGGPLPAASAVVLRKAGVDPTYYAVTATGDATSNVTGRYNAFDFNAQQRTLTVGLSTLTAIPGIAAGSVIVDNIDISSQAAGQGAADGNDSIALSLTIYDHADGSFAPAVNQDALTIDLGNVTADAGVQTAAFDIFNLVSSSGFTADLDILTVAATGDSDVLTTDAAAFTGVTPGLGVTFDAAFDPTGLMPGDYTAVYTIAVADENLPGGTAGASLVLTIVGTVVAATSPFDADNDGDVDDADWANFADCMTGPGGSALAACALHDNNSDNDIDLEDAAAFQGAFTGPLP